MNWNSVIPLVRHKAIQAICASVLLACTIALSPPAQSQPPEVSLQEDFDALPTPNNLPQGSDALSFTASSGRTVYYSTFGDKDGEPVLFLDGTLHSVALGDLLAPYRRMSKRLGLYFIHPIRGGYGVPYDATMTPQKYADDYAELMTHLGYVQFKVVSISAGGTYADHLAVSHPSRIKSMHLVASEDTLPSNTFICNLYNPTNPDSLLGIGQFLFSDPTLVYTYILPPRDYQTSVSIPGLVNWFYGALPLSADPVNQSDIGLSHDLYVMCNFPLNQSDFVAATFPTYIYHGELDVQNVTIDNAENHAAQYPNVAKFRRYPNDAHFTSLRHMGQVLVDLAGMGNKTLLCHEGKTKLVSENNVENLLAEGDILDICAWKGTPGE